MVIRNCALMMKYLTRYIGHLHLDLSYIFLSLSFQESRKGIDLSSRSNHRAIVQKHFRHFFLIMISRKNNKKKGKYEGQYSDLFLLHQRCICHEIEDLSPIALGERNNTPYLRDNEKKHIDLYKIYSKEIIKNGVFNKKYRTDRLEDVGLSLSGIGKYIYTDPSTGSEVIVNGENVNDLPFNVQMKYVARDAELTMLLACYNDCLALEIMKYIALYSEMDYYRCCHTGVSQWYSNIYKNMIKRRECIFEYNQSKK